MAGTLTSTGSQRPEAESIPRQPRKIKYHAPTGSDCGLRDIDFWPSVTADVSTLPELKNVLTREPLMPRTSFDVLIKEGADWSSSTKFKDNKALPADDPLFVRIVASPKLYIRGPFGLQCVQ